MEKKNYLHVCVGDTIRAEIDLVLHTRIVEGRVVEKNNENNIIKIDITSDSQQRSYDRPNIDCFHICHVTKILEKTSMPSSLLKKMPASMEKMYFTNKKNVWCGPVVSMVNAIFRTDRRTQDFIVDGRKLKKLWTKNYFPGLLEYGEHGIHYVKADKFKTWVLRNACNLRKNMSTSINEQRKEREKYAQQYYEDLDLEDDV